MLPWGHAAFGYLLYTVFSRVRYRRPPVGLSVYALALGTQFPDLVDKPLAWNLALLPSGRSLAHSLFAFTILLGALWTLSASPTHRRLVVAFGVGWLSHLVGDGVVPALDGDWADLGYLLWPVTSYAPARPHFGVLRFLRHIEPSPRLWMGVAMAVLVVGVWLFDGAPGVADLYARRYGDSAEKRA